MDQRESEIRQLSARLEATKSQLETLRRIQESNTDDTDSAFLRQSFDKERKQLQTDLKDWEAQYAHLEALKRGLERDAQRTQAMLHDKEEENQVAFLLPIH